MITTMTRPWREALVGVMLSAGLVGLAVRGGAQERSGAPAAPLLSPAARAAHAALYARCTACRVIPAAADPAAPTGDAPAWAGEAGRTALAAQRAGLGPPPVGMPDLPAVRLDPATLPAVLVVEGTVAAVDGQLTPDGQRAFTVVGVAAVRVVRASALQAVADGATVVVSRPGGTVVVDGTSRTATVAGYAPLAVGARVRLALVPVAGTEGFQEVRLPAGVLEQLVGGAR